MKKNRFFFPILIVLMIIFIPFTGVLVYKEIINKQNGGNPNHLPYFEGKLYFYNNKDKYIGAYECESSDCKIASATSNDLYSFYDYTTDEIDISDTGYIFIEDGNTIKVYNLNNDKVIANFSLIKNYNKETNQIIIRNSQGREGILNYSKLMFDISSDYLYIGYRNIKDDIIIVQKDDGWHLMDKQNNLLTSPIKYPIYDFDGKHVYTKNGDDIVIFSYDGNNPLENMPISKLDKYSNYLIILSRGIIRIYNASFEVIKSYGYYNSNFNYEINDNILIINNNGVKFTELNLDELGSSI